MNNYNQKYNKDDVFIRNMIVSLLAEMNKKNVAKANKLYDYIDGSGFYKCPVRKQDRSLMNVPFVTDSEELAYAVQADGFDTAAAAWTAAFAQN